MAGGRHWRRAREPVRPPPHVRRSDGVPCHGQPLGHSKSDQTPAGLLARGSSLDARPSQASHDLASGPVAARPGHRGQAICIALAAYSCRDSRGFGQPRPPAPHSLLSPSRGTGAIMKASFRMPSRSSLGKYEGMSNPFRVEGKRSGRRPLPVQFQAFHTSARKPAPKARFRIGSPLSASRDSGLAKRRATMLGVHSSHSSAVATVISAAMPAQ
ncbi:hypothetical protein BHE75_01234 [Sphingomonas haloaromaticamans]|uniref:Uncharacterized protein n=1 Tax=Edaphosphingomonas haloaromaticamans TaxID=653954 RepID=A0A1S1HCT3_9SPHN|nr:hypothetical protein BHE75_01234 [Sphingomonas haloaromaticamans]